MSETTTMVCDGCGEVIDTNNAHLTICINRLLDYRKPKVWAEPYGTRHDLHGINCIPAWLEKMPPPVRQQFRYANQTDTIEVFRLDRGPHAVYRGPERRKRREAVQYERRTGAMR